MKNAGFKEVLWTNGNAPELKTVCMIGAFPVVPLESVIGVKDAKKPPKAVLESVVYKKVGDTEIYVDVYYPVDSDSSITKWPIGKLEP
jgi:hypothetical protein